MYLVNDKGQSMTCGLYSGLGEGQASGEKVEAGSEVPYRSISISVQIVDLVAEVSLTYKFLNAGDKPIQPTFLFPLNDSGVLCDVEVMVDAERRIASDVDPEATKRILEQKETFKGDEQEVHVVRAGEVPVNSEITIKCTYVAIFNIVGGAVKFILPSHLIPTRQHEQDGAKDPLRVSVSMEMHDMVQEVVSESHPESVASCATFVGGKATAEILVGAGGLSTDLVLLIRVKDPMAPRAWTSVGLSGGIPSRMSMFVLSPPFHENDGGLSKEGEVILFLDVREDNKADMPQILRASLEKLPRWAYFNVWASFDGASVAPVFEQAVAATDQSFQDAIAKFNTRVPFSGDESTLLTSVQTLLSQPISFPPRILFFVTSMGAHVDEALKVIASTSATTRNVVVLLNSKWNKAYLPQLLTLNGGSVVRSNTQELETLLPKLIEQTVQPTQSLSFTSTPNPTYQFPVSVPPLFLGSSYTFFMTSYDRLSPSEEVTITLGLDENGAAVKAKHVNSQTLHRLGSHALLSELNAGTRKDLTPHQKDTIATVLYSPWIFQPTTPKERHLVQTFSEPSLSAKNKQDSSSISSMITAFRSGKTDFPGVTSKPSALTMPSKRQSTPSLTDGGAKGNLSLREKRLQMHKSASKVFDMCASDYADRTKISLAELEPHSLDIGINFIKETVSPARQLTATDATSLRSIILPIIEGAKDKEFCSEGIVDVTKLKPLIHDAVKEKWSAESDAAFWYEVSNTAEKGARPHMEDQNCVVDAANDLYGLSNQPRMAFFGVFDGHSGKLAAEYTKTHLPYNVLRHAAFDATKLGSEDDAGVRTAFTEGYLKTDADFMAIAEKDSLKAGTTAVTLLLLDEYMVISNVGDSEAVVCRDGKAVQLSTLHTPTNEKEKQRVAAAGGAIVHYGTWRVNGVLAVTRSIGDRTLKEQVTAHPDTAIEKITDKDEFIILATDGVWEAVSHQEAVDLVRKEREKEREKKEGEQEDTRSISRRLVDEAVRKESKDNITAVVIFFKHK